MKKNEEYPYSDLTNKIIGAAIEVHRNLGPGFMEIFYEKALVKELMELGLRLHEQEYVPVIYKDEILGEQRIDLVIEDTVVVENKCVRELNPVHKAQVLSYLKGTNLKVGLLLNFGKEKLEIKRLISK